MKVLGIGGAAGPDAACAVAIDGELRAALERRKTPHGRLPIEETLALAKIRPTEVDSVAVARKAPEPVLSEIRRLMPQVSISLLDHHFAHAASAYFASGLAESTVLTADSGEDLTSARLWQASSGAIEGGPALLWPDSVGDLFSRVTELLGFKRDADEHKVQWMSTAGDTRFVDLFRQLLGEPWRPIRALDDRFYESLGIEHGVPIADALKPHIAAGLQRAVEDYVLEMAGEGENLCLAGGLFFNVLLVHRLETSGRWKRVFVQPAAGNSGTAIGAAYAASSTRQPMTTLALGPEFSAEEIKQVLENCKLRFRYLLTLDEVRAAAIRLLGEHKIVGWMQGRVEFGPRALGNRSILASPLDPFASENLNVYIKHREPFRKFAAAVPAELAAEFFDAGPNTRYLASLGRVRDVYRDRFAPAVLGDGLIRVHAVDRTENPLFHRLLVEFGEHFGLPVLYNTSFNLFGDPLASTPRDAVRSFYSSGIDALIAGNFVVEK
jgi:carbamoyltransferase